MNVCVCVCVCVYVSVKKNSPAAGPLPGVALSGEQPPAARCAGAEGRDFFCFFVVVRMCVDVRVVLCVRDVRVLCVRACGVRACVRA